MHASIGQDPRVSQRGGAGHLWRLRHGGQDGPGKKVRNIARIIKLKLKCCLPMLLPCHCFNMLLLLQIFKEFRGEKESWWRVRGSLYWVFCKQVFVFPVYPLGWYEAPSLPTGSALVTSSKFGRGAWTKGWQSLSRNYNAKNTHITKLLSFRGSIFTLFNRACWHGWFLFEWNSKLADFGNVFVFALGPSHVGTFLQHTL